MVCKDCSPLVKLMIIKCLAYYFPRAPGRYFDFWNIPNSTKNNSDRNMALNEVYDIKRATHSISTSTISCVAFLFHSASLCIHLQVLYADLLNSYASGLLQLMYLQDACLWTYTDSTHLGIAAICACAYAYVCIVPVCLCFL